MKSKELATIDTHVAVELDLAAMVMREPDAEAARQLFSELEFNSLLKDFLPSVEVGATNYREAESACDLEALVKGLAKGAALAVAVPVSPASTEVAEDSNENEAAIPEDEDESGQGQLGLSTGGPEAVTPPLSAATRVQKIAISAAPGAVLTVPLNSDAVATLMSILADASIPKAIHNYKAALHALAGAGQQAELAGVRDEPMLFSYLLDPTYSSHSLPEIALRRFNVKLGESPTAPEDKNPEDTRLAVAADTTGRLADALRSEVEEAGLMRVYDEIDLPLVPVLARMEQAGVKLDSATLAEMSQRLDRECKLKTREIYESAGEEFNINSPKQLGQVLFEKLALPKPFKRGKGRAISTAVDVLEALATEHAVPRLVLEYRQLAKLKSTYVDALPALVNPSTQRLHTTFDQTNTATGRLSSKNPNLQNIPIRTELGREIRAAFIAEPGCLLLSADYSQVELRLLAHFSRDPLLLEAFQRGDDIHTLTAAQVFGVPPLMVTPEHRRRAKAINFGIPYGLSPFGLAQQLGIENGEAKQFIDTYFERYRGVRAWLDATMEQARHDQMVATLFGRIRPIPDINSKNANLRGFAERTAVNTPLQGTAADLIKLAMIHLDAEVRARGWQSRMTLQVHDELVFEAPETEIEALRALVRDKMENVYKLRVPLLVEMGVGKNWRDME
jgi:DNA polymerase-1